MPLKKTVKCPYHEGFFLELRPRYKDHPYLCPWCHGKLEYETTVYLSKYEGKFTSIDYREDIGIKNDDIYVEIICVCNETFSLSDYEPIVCNCGRIYRLGVSIDVDETHIGEFDYLIEESEKR